MLSLLFGIILVFQSEYQSVTMEIVYKSGEHRIEYLAHTVELENDSTFILDNVIRVKRSDVINVYIVQEV